MGRKKEKSRKREESINAFFGTIVIFLIYYLIKVTKHDRKRPEKSFNHNDDSNVHFPMAGSWIVSESIVDVPSLLVFCGQPS